MKVPRTPPRSGSGVAAPRGARRAPATPPDVQRFEHVANRMAEVPGEHPDELDAYVRDGFDTRVQDRSLELFHGEQGTTVKLTIRRPREGTLRFTVERDDIALPTVRSRLLPRWHGKVGYVKLLSFRANAADMVAVYFPMSYQIGGYTLYLHKDQLQETDLSVEEAMRLVLIGGVTSHDTSSNAPRE